MKISLCTFVKNETDWIEQMLRSVVGLVDEINVLDTGSTDGTKDIVCQLLVSKEFKNIDFAVAECEFTDFADIRKKCFDMATMDRVLMLDADETINKYEFDLWREVAILPHHDGMYMTRRNWHPAGWDACRPVADMDPALLANPKYFAAYPNYQARLFKNDPKITWVNKVHEQPDVNIVKTDGHKGDPHIEHFHYLRPARQRHEAYDHYNRLGQGTV